ncbi:hypothetical protein [Campylobacter geochelonis]|uniref:hypothetical protein n=1 Tax=Campylobacter geochelonis TaxID=1780362 RepID=UPI0010550C5D|nr:hypothetical protein [Campylobacter geochelonis]
MKNYSKNRLNHACQHTPYFLQNDSLKHFCHNCTSANSNSIKQVSYNDKFNFIITNHNKNAG